MMVIAEKKREAKGESKRVWSNLKFNGSPIIIPSEAIACQKHSLNLIIS